MVFQNTKLNGPARKRQKNSSFPAGTAPSSVKKYIRVKKSHIPDTGTPKHPDLRLTHTVYSVLESSMPFTSRRDSGSCSGSRYSRSSWRAMVWRWISDVPS